MDELALILNAGSSSLKFAVFGASGGTEDWPVLVRGNLEGIGTSPQMSAHDGAGSALETPPLPAAISDAAGALEHVFGWLSSKFSTGRIVAVGH
ncbi:MAG: acetate kinase, partial [Gammaproteobacteria bacterium]|nr:acetate kinase [Gammaproteobacteria bacterium]